MNPSLKICSDTTAVLKNPCVKSTLDKLYEQRQESGDIKFVIGSETIHAHRCVLAALSPKYKAQFYGAMLEKDVVNVNGVSAAAFNEFLNFFYTDEVTLTIDNIEDVLDLAKQSLVDDFFNGCTQFLKEMTALYNKKSLWCYKLALRYEIKTLEELCVNQISANIKSIFLTVDFLKCDEEMLCQILDLDLLNCYAMDVFDGCISWARANCEQDGLDGANTANLRAALGNALFKIPFCSMTTEQFATIVENFSGLLSPQESTEVFCTIALKANGKTSSIFGNELITRKPIQKEPAYSPARSENIILNIGTRAGGFFN